MVGTLARPLALAALAACAACAATNVPPIDRAEFSPEADERELWNHAGKVDDALANADVLYEDAALQRYMDRVVARLMPHLESPEVPVRVRVLKDPFLNAFALPNGTVYVHTGLLARVDSEAQLATVIGHEIAHFVGRHSLRETRTAQNRRTAAQVVLGILAIAAAGASGDANAARAIMNLGEAIANPVVEAQVNGYSRDLEREADARSFTVLVASGYDPREAPQVFVHLQDDTREAGVEEPYYFGSHPRLAERIENYQELLEAWTADGSTSAPRVGRDELNAAISQLLLDNAGYDIDLGRIARARRAIDRHLAFRPSSAPGYFQLGEAYRRSGAIEQAKMAYEESARFDPTYAAPHRELGLLYRSTGSGVQARTFFGRYLALAPDAADRRIIQAYCEEPATEESE